MDTHARPDDSARNRSPPRAPIDALGSMRASRATIAESMPGGGGADG